MREETHCTKGSPGVRNPNCITRKKNIVMCKFGLEKVRSLKVLSARGSCAFMGLVLYFWYIQKAGPSSGKDISLNSLKAYKNIYKLSIGQKNKKIKSKL